MTLFWPSCNTTALCVRSVRSHQERNFWMQRRSAKNGHSNARTLRRDPNPGTEWPEIPTERAIRCRAGKARFAETGWWCAQSDTNRSPCYLPNIRVIFEKKQRADYEKSQKCLQTCGFLPSGQIREQGETGTIDRCKQGHESADSGSKTRNPFAARCPLSMSVFEG